MATAPKQEQSETQPTPFFTTLRRLARQVDNGIKDIQQKLETQPGHGENSHVATKLLLDKRKEMEAVKKSSRSSLADMRKRNSDFERMLQLCRDVVDQQMNQLTVIQQYLAQYGYSPSEGKTACEEKPVADDESKESVEHKSEPAEQETKRSEMRMSPRLEDFGISSYTLNMMSRQQPQQADFKVPYGVRTNIGDRKQLDSVPTPFQNKGLTVTPSLFSSKYQSTISKDDMSLSLACSPMNTVFKTPVDTRVGASVRGRASPEPPDLAKALDFADSPVPPVLHTPGMKQIPRMKEFMAQTQKENEQLSSPVPPVFLTPGLKQIPTKGEMTQEQGRGHKVAKQLKLGDDRQPLDSPVPPVLKTPGIKQINKGPASGVTDIPGKGEAFPSFPSRAYADDLEVPKTPELTFSLKDLEEMTMSFRNASLTTSYSEKTTSLTSDLDNSKFIPTTGYGTQARHHQDRRGGTDSAHTFESFTSSRMYNPPSEPPLPNLRTNRFGFTTNSTGVVDMPETPELKSVSMMKSQSVQAHRQGFGTSQLRQCKQEGAKSSETDQSWRSAVNVKQEKPEAVESSFQADYHRPRHSTEENTDKFAVRESDTARLDSYRSGFRPYMKTSAQSAGHYGERMNTYGDKENLEIPATPELTSTKFDDVGALVQPRLTQPLGDSNLDLPPTPKFMGSYHFMGSKR